MNIEEIQQFYILIMVAMVVVMVWLAIYKLTKGSSMASEVIGCAVLSGLGVLIGLILAFQL